MNAMGLYWWLVNIGSGTGLVPLGNKPLPIPLLIEIYSPSAHSELTHWDMCLEF